MNLEVEQADQSRRCRNATLAKMPSITELASQINGTPPSTDATSRMDAALPEPSTAARVAGDELLLYTAARGRLGKCRALDEYMKGVADGVQLAKNQLLM